MHTNPTSLEEWSRSWQLQFNADKFRSIHFGSKNPKYVYTLNGLELKQISSDLEVLADDKLKYHVHATPAV